MPTTKTRINISLSPTMEKALAQLARRDRIPQATKAAKLLETAVELEEDQVWDALARERDVKGARFVSHDKAWA
jgi:hypothetical protein